MATVKFRDDSPYIKSKVPPPAEDYLYKKYVDDLSLKTNLKPAPVVRVAIFGLGRAGTIHMSNCANNPRIKILYVVEDLQEKWQDIRNYWRLDFTKILTSKQADQVFKDTNVDAIIVASPSHTHEGIVTKALEARKPVFCEKPIAEDRQRTVNCYETAANYGKPLFCAFNRRFDPSYETVKERIRKGEVGHVHMIKLVARDSPLPTIEYLASSGGIFHDCMVHDIDLMTWMLGEYPAKVTVQAHAHIPEIKAINDYDTVAAILYFPSGTLGMIELSRNSCYGYDQRVEVFGPKGSIEAKNEQPMHCVTSQHGFSGIRTPPIWYSFASRFKNAYAREMDQFIDVVLGRAKPSVHPKETLAVSKIATACEESARSGKVVALRWDDDELPPKQ